MKRLAVLTVLAACASPQTPVGVVSPRTTPTATSPAVAPTPLTSDFPRLREASRSRWVEVPRATGTLTDTTCYAATGNRTASGKWPRVGMAASNTYDFGTRLLVQRVGPVIVEDRIGHGTSLDIFGPSEAFCRHFGRQQLRVQVITP